MNRTNDKDNNTICIHNEDDRLQVEQIEGVYQLHGANFWVFFHYAFQYTNFDAPQ
jgi:hypothetical protein